MFLLLFGFFLCIVLPLLVRCDLLSTAVARYTTRYVRSHMEGNIPIITMNMMICLSEKKILRSIAAEVSIPMTAFVSDVVTFRE